MALKIRYQTTYEPFKVVDDIKEIPKDATIVWYDFDEPNEQENEWFKAHFNFNDLEVMMQLTVCHELNINLIKIINT